MLSYINGDIFQSSSRVLVNPVNTVGIMGKGLALSFKKRFPDMFAEYRRICNRHLLRTGKVWFWKGRDKNIVLFPTKDHWRDRSTPAHISSGLAYFVQHYRDWDIPDIAFPALGCGCGGLDYETDVKPLLEAHLSPLVIPCQIFVPPIVYKTNRS